MKRFLVLVALALLAAGAASAQTAQEKAASREATRESLRKLLAASGPKKGIGIDFRQSEKNPFNFVGVKRDGLANVDFFEVVIGISDNETIGFRIYPHYKDGYVNIGKVRDSAGLMRTLLRQSDTNFLYWGADSGGDIFAGYTFTLESGFPDKAVEVVLYSIAPLDGFVGQMRPFIDGSAAP